MRIRTEEKPMRIPLKRLLPYYEEPIWAEGREYARDGRAILLTNESGAYISTATVYLDVPMRSNEVAIKNYSENEGVLDLLIAEDLIKPEPVDEVPSGHVTIPIHKLTPKGLSLYSETKET